MTYDFDSADTTPSVFLLAESVEISSDGLTYTFTLRQGVTFHDGTAFNATSVQMNFWRMLGRGWDDGWGPAWMVAEPILGGQAIEDAVYEHGDGSPQHIGNWTEWMENSDAIVVIDEFIVRIQLAYAYTPFLSVLVHPVCSMISPTYFMAHGGMAPVGDSSFMDEHACGTGPYKLEEWIQDDRIELTLVNDYWRTQEAKSSHPNAGSIAKVTLQFNSDSDNRYQNLQRGSSDGCYWMQYDVYDIWNNVTTRGNGTIQSLDPNLKVWLGSPDYSIMCLGFSMNPYMNFSDEIRLNPFTNYELRSAVSYAFDYQAPIDDVLNGIGIQLQGPIPQGMFAHDDDLFMYSLDMEEAVEHWNLAMDNGLDEIWANNSYELNILYNEGGLNRYVIAHLIKQAIENIVDAPSSIKPTENLTINVIPIEWANYLYLVRNRQLPVFFFGWFPDYADPDNFIKPFAKTSSTYPRRIGLAGSTGRDGELWDSVTVDGWIDAAATESDPSARISLYAQIQEVIVEHCAYIWCYQSVEFHVERHEMNGYVFNPMRQPYFFHYYKLGGLDFEDIPMEVFIASAIVVGVIAIVVLRESTSKKVRSG